MTKSEAINELAAALSKAQGEMTNPKFDTSNPFFKSRYASLSTVRDAVVPPLSKNGIAVTQLVQSTPAGVECETVLMHASGQWVSSTLYLPSGKHDAQGYGSAITYARRYALMAICGVVGDEDDDGNAASLTRGADKPRQQPQGEKPATSIHSAVQKPHSVAAASGDKGFFKDGTPSEGVTTDKGMMFEEYKTASSKPGAKGKPWCLHIGKFSTDSGSAVEACTFDATLGARMAELEGQEVDIAHRPGRKAGTRELTGIGPADDVDNVP